MDAERLHTVTSVCPRLLAFLETVGTIRISSRLDHASAIHFGSGARSCIPAIDYGSCIHPFLGYDHLLPGSTAASHYVPCRSESTSIGACHGSDLPVELLLLASSGKHYDLGGFPHVGPGKHPGHFEGRCQSGNSPFHCPPVAGTSRLNAIFCHTYPHHFNLSLESQYCTQC